MSRLYPYVKNQYLLGAFSDAELVTLVGRNVITESERVELVALKIA